MLILARKVDRRITIGESIEIVVVEVGEGWVRLGITAPRSIPVYRKELLKEIAAENAEAAATASVENNALLFPIEGITSKLTSAL
jgi:carbon storage regulator